MNRYSRWFAVGVLAVVAAVVPLVGCKPNPGPTPAGNTDGVKVAVTFPALYSMAANVVGDTGTVASVKGTQGAHGSEVTKTELDAVGSADILFANGLGLDDEFAKKLAASSSNQNLKVVKLGDQLNKRKHSLMLHSDGPCVEGEEVHEHDGHDPHVWMGLDRAVRYVDYICEALSEHYPAHKDTFYANGEVYKDKLKAIKAEGEAALAGTKKEDRKIVTAHGSMAYFADTFKITVVDFIQKSAGREPSKKQLDELVEKCKKEGVKVIASEPQFSKLGGVKALADELKRLGMAATVIELDNLESATAADLKPDWYETKMRANIAALKDVFK
jgi:zinc transport system substrate-binding protein